MLGGREAHSDYLECAADAVALLVDDEAPVLHPARREEAHVSRSRELLRGAAHVVRGRRDAVGRADDIEVVGDERFVRDEEEEGEVFEDGDLRDARVRDDTLPAARVVVLRDVHTEVGAYGDHLLSAWLVESRRAVYPCAAHWRGSTGVLEHLLNIADRAVQRRAFDHDSYLPGYRTVICER